jgi:hypothetical protein
MTEPDPNHPQAERVPGFSESLSAAARQTGLAKITPGETPTASALLGALGGVRGLIESVVPGFAFLVLYTVLPASDQKLIISVLVPVAIALIFVVARAGARSPMTQAIAGAVGIGLTAVLAIVTKNASNNFLPGIFINAGAFVIFVASILARRPLVGVLVGLIVSDAGWRADPAKRRALTLATWVWIIPFVVRLAVEVPLYLAHNVPALAATKLITGIPLYIGTLWITWLLVRAVYPPDAARDKGAEGDTGIDSPE